MWYNTNVNQTEQEQSPAAKSAERENWNYLYLVIKNRGGSNDEATLYANRGGGGPNANTNQTEHKTEEHERAKTGEEVKGIFRDPLDTIVIPLFVIWLLLAPFAIVVSIATIFGPGLFVGFVYFMILTELEPDCVEDWRLRRHIKKHYTKKGLNYQVECAKQVEENIVRNQASDMLYGTYEERLRGLGPIQQKPPYKGHAGYEGF
jgi:hypothetical protein